MYSRYTQPGYGYTWDLVLISFGHSMLKAEINPREIVPGRSDVSCYGEITMVTSLRALFTPFECTFTTHKVKNELCKKIGRGGGY